MRIPLLVTLLAVASSGVLAQSQSIHRCGPGGRVLQQHPCGSAMPPAGRSADAVPDQRAAAQRIRQLQAQADRMERERLAAQARDLRANAEPVGIQTRPPPPDAKAPEPKTLKLRTLGAAQPVRRAAPAPRR